MKQLPNDKQIEESLLWCMLIDQPLAEEFMMEGELEYFYNSHTYKIVKAIYTLLLEGSNVDLVTVKNYLEEKGSLSSIGGMTYLVELTEYANTTSWRTYAHKLRELYRKRGIIQNARALENIWYNSESLDEDVTKTYDSVSWILAEGVSKSTNTENNIELLQKHIEENKWKDLLWWSWWLDWLDRYTKWIRKSKTYRIGAPSWVGKTNLVYQVVYNLLNQWAKVLFVSLENSIETTYIKFLSTVQECNPNAIEYGQIEPDYNYLKKHKDNFILTDQLFNIWEIKREVIKQKPDVVILDYVWLVHMHRLPEKEKYDAYADEIKEFIQKHQDIAWIDLSNLNKDDDETKIKMHKWFNGSAKLRNNTDVSIHMFYHKPFYDYKQIVFENGSDESKQKFMWKQAITFYISKNRLWVDGIEKQFLINFNKGIRYTEASDELIEKWATAI